ncbi:condensation domain-containing protein [Nonomuraea angiospora]|uniref:condensation domain-containing protein n=1 Tax=Nonomuraea angiospora TaxID=46172 RepID=UPI00332D0F53
MPNVFTALTHELTLTECEPIAVSFQGDRAGDGPLTLGQLNILRWLDGFPDAHGWMRWALELPEGTELDDVTETFAVLLARHEGLRSTYAAGPPPAQRVAAAGELIIHRFDAGAGPVESVALAAELGTLLDTRPPYSPKTHPLRVALATRGGKVLAGVMDLSHLTADFLGLAVFGREFAHLVRHPAEREIGQARHQPLDQAWAERRPPLERRTASALALWESVLNRAPHHLYTAASTGSPRDSVAAELCSPAAATALAEIEARVGYGRPAIVLAAICAVLSQRTGHCAGDFLTLSSNRYDSRSADYLGTLVQSAPMRVDLESMSFDRCVHQAWLATVKAGKHGIYDVEKRSQISGRAEHRRGVRFCFEPLFNNLVVGRLDSQPPEAPAETALTWTPMVESDVMLRFDLFAAEETLRLRLWTGHLDRVPRDELERILLAIEHLLLSAASEDLSRPRMDEITGLGPLPRDGDWLLVDSCWIQVGEVQRLLDEVLTPLPARVFPEVRGEPLVAFLARGPRVRSAEEAHALCMEGLRRRPTAMTPRRYVLCDHAPDDVSDLDAWLGRPVVAEGAGRTTGQPG